MKNKIKEFALSIGIEQMGVTQYNGKTAVVCLFPYFNGYENGNLSSYAYSIDYHLITKKKLDELCRYILQNTSASYAEGFADIGPSVDKELACNAGLGFYGKNTLMINDRLGSYFFIGYVLTDLFLEPDAPMVKECIGCGRCIAACPGNALENGFHIDSCVSAINQKKGDLTYEEKALIKKAGFSFGCDICQKVCPHNNIKFAPMAEFLENRIYNLTEEMFSGLSNKEFRQRYGNYAFSWRGKAVLLRNIRILKENK